MTISSPKRGSKTKGYHQRERDFWLACAAGLLGDAFDTLNALVVDKLDSIIRASSLVEMVNGLIRPSLNSCKGQITQETLNLIMFYHNHRRYKSGKRQGKAPLELLTGTPLETPWWELLRRQFPAEQGVTDSDTVPARPPLHLLIPATRGRQSNWRWRQIKLSSTLPALQRTLADNSTRKRPKRSLGAHT